MSKSHGQLLFETIWGPGANWNHAAQEHWNTLANNFLRLAGAHPAKATLTGEELFLLKPGRTRSKAEDTWKFAPPSLKDYWRNFAGMVNDFFSAPAAAPDQPTECAKCTELTERFRRAKTRDVLGEGLRVTHLLDTPEYKHHQTPRILVDREDD